MHQRNVPRISNLSDLLDWFYAAPDEAIYWKLYRDWMDKKKQGNHIASNQVMMLKDESWNELERVLLSQSKNGGRFTLFLTEKPKDQYGSTTFLEISPVNGMVPYQGGDANQMNGMQGYGQQVPGQMQTAYSPYGNVQQVVAQERRMWELEQQNKDLASTVEYMQEKEQSDKSFKEKIMESVANDPMAILDKCINMIGMLGMAAGQPQGRGTQVAMQGVGSDATVEAIPKPNHPQDVPAPQTVAAETTATEEERIVDFDRINPAIDELEDLGIHTDEVIPMLARIAAKNPEKVKALLADESKISGILNFL